jgi:hypothetical protein
VKQNDALLLHVIKRWNPEVRESSDSLTCQKRKSNEKKLRKKFE